jgi:hypothetical protein
MANKVLLKKSSTVAKVPVVGDLDYGEIALNYADGKLYFKNSTNVVQPLGIAYTKVIANTTAKINQGYIANTAAGSFTITLPSSPQTGNYVIIVDDASFDTNPLFIARNGEPIVGVYENLTLNIAGVSVTLLYDGGQWNVYTQVGATGGTGAGTEETVHNYNSFASSLVPSLNNTYRLGNTSYGWTSLYYGDGTVQSTSSNADGTSITNSSGTITAQAGGLAGNTLKSTVINSSLQTLGTQTQRINWQGSGVAAPQFSSSSVGTKLLLYPNISGSTADFAIGIDSATIWNGVPENSASYFFKWYGGTTNVATLTGAGALTLAGDLAVNGSDITTTGSGTATVFNANATTLNIGGAATTVSIGAATGTATINNANVVITGNLTVNGTTTTVNSTTITVDDINIELGSVASPTDITANGGGITLKGATDKTLNWVSSTAAWTSSEDFNLLTGKVYEINGTTVLSATTLGSGVTGSSLTSVGTIGTGVWNGTVVTGQYGGTGVNNSGKTITIGGNFTHTGAHTLGLTTSANTSVTLPTTGTLATLAGSETFTNKTLTSPIISTISNTGTLTLPTSTDTLVGRATTDTLTNKTLTSPTMTTPTLGVASATSINKVAITAPATGSTLTIAEGKTLTASNTLTFTGTDASSVAFGAGGTVLYSGGALGTPSSATLTNATGLPVSGITASTSTAIGVGSIELGHATDTTIARSSAGVISVEGVVVPTVSSTNTLTNKTLTAPVIDNIKMGYSTTVTAAGTTTLTASSNYRQLFTGTTTQTIVLPVTSTLVTGMSFEIENVSTGNLTVNSSGGNLVVTVLPGTCAHVLCIGTAATTAADWDADFISFSAVTGTGSVVLSTNPTLVVTDTAFTLRDDADPTKQAQFQLSGITTGTTRTLQLPNADTTLIGTAGGTFSGGVGFNSTVTFNNATSSITASALTTGLLTLGGASGTGILTFGQSTASQTTNIQAGSTASGSTKTINFGTGGLTGSTTTMTIGSTFGTTIAANGTWTYSGANAYGTPTSITLTNATGLPVATGISGLGTGVASALGIAVGSAGGFVTNGPVFRAYVDTAQTITSSGTQQKVTFGTETFDSNSNFASSRFTPTVAGYYQLNAAVRISGGSSTGETMLVIWKNGSEYARGTNQSGTEQGASFYSMQVSDIAVANGSTDYFEIYIQQTSGVSRDITAGSNISHFSGCMIRGA